MRQLSPRLAILGTMTLILLGAGWSVGAAAVTHAKDHHRVAACAAYLPPDGVLASLQARSKDAATGEVSMSPAGSTKVSIEARDDAFLLYLPSSKVMKQGVYFSRTSGTLTIPGIGVAQAKSVKSGCQWSGVETYADSTVKKGTVTMGPQVGQVGACALTATFHKVVHGKAMVDEDFTAIYPCGVAR